MGKYNGKVLTIYITPSGVRVAEGENKNGSPHISRFFVVHGIEDFFTEVQTEPGVYEVTNMTGLVGAIVDECKNRRANCRRVMVCSNCFGIETEIKTGCKKGSVKDLLTGDIMSAAKRKDKIKDEKLPPDKMSCKADWGELVEDGVVSKRATESIGDKFMLKSLVQEFYNRGYDVISISDNVGVLFNLRQSEEATFDSQGKVIFDFDTNLHVICLKKDIPVSIEHFAMMTVDEASDRVENLLMGTSETVGRNPKVYFTGALMANTDMYSTLIDHIEGMGFVVYDAFDRPDAGPDGDESVLTADYTANIALFMNAYAKNVVSILPAIEFSEVFKKNSKAIAAIFLVLSLGCLVVSGYFAGSRFLQMQQIHSSPSQVSSLENQIQALNANQNSLNSTIATLTQADVTVLDLVNFIEYNQSEFVTVVSMDTADMLPHSVSVEDAVVTDETAGDEYGGSAGGGIRSRQPIIIRGYARSGPAAIDYYDRLFHSGLYADPVLNGVEKYELPNGEEVFIFEIQVGGAE